MRGAVDVVGEVGLEEGFDVEGFDGVDGCAADGDGGVGVSDALEDGLLGGKIRIFLEGLIGV